MDVVEFAMSRARKPPIVTGQLNHALEEKVRELDARLQVLEAERDRLRERLDAVCDEDAWW